MGGLSEDLQITRVEGHQSSLEAGDSIDKVGNDFAGVAAKKGTALHGFPVDAYEEHKRLLKA
eukprot:3821872-Pyramimonas_sp.AAC.1